MTTFEVTNKLYKTINCKYSLNNRNKGSKGLLLHTEHVSGDIRQQGGLHEGALQPLPTSNYNCSLCHSICDLTLHLKETTALNPFISTKFPLHDLSVCVRVAKSEVFLLFLHCSKFFFFFFSPLVKFLPRRNADWASFGRDWVSFD